MKKIFFLFCAFVFSISLFPQAPQGINYQGVARDPNGAAISSTNIGLEFKIWDGNPSGGGSMIYSEVHPTVATDTFGLYTSVIGSASGSGTGTFSSIPWSTGNKWIEVYIDPTASGTNYLLVSSQQLMSVPYALYAATSGTGGGGGSVSGTANNIPRINNAGNGLGRSLISQSPDSLSIGINNPNPMADAVLDIVNTGAPGAAGKGLLIPRMSFTERTNISVSSLHHGLMVFQTNSSGISAPQGIWYYDAVSSAWLLLAPAQAVWTMSGNAVGTSGFIGTLDDKDIIFKTGFLTPTERMRVLSNTNGGNVQFGNSSTATHYIFPAAKGNAGDILRMDPSGTNNLVWTPSGTSATTWVRNGGIVSTVNTTDTVGIGTANPRTTLEVVSTNPKGALNVTNSGLAGGAGIFSIASTTNDSAALIGYTKGGGIAIMGITDGNNHAGAFGVLNPSSSASGVISSTSGSGRAIMGINTGTGYGGLFMINNAANDSAAVGGITSGKGPGVVGYNLGLGNAGFFQVTNSTNTHGAIDAITNGAGSAANFQVSNSSNVASVINVGTSGTGTGVSVTTNAGSAVDAINSGGGHTINAKNNGVGGNAGNFIISNNSNGNSAIAAVTSGTGNAVNATSNGTGAAIKATNTSAGGFSGDFNGGAGLSTDKLRIVAGSFSLPQAGYILTSTNVMGDAGWMAMPGSFNFSVPMSATSQTFSASNPLTSGQINFSTVFNYSNGSPNLTGSAFNVVTGGVYHIDAQVSISGNTPSGGIMNLYIYDQASNAVLRQTQAVAPAGGGAFLEVMSISTDLMVNSGAKIALYFTNTSTGTTFTVNNGVNFSWFNVHRVY